MATPRYAYRVSDEQLDRGDDLTQSADLNVLTVREVSQQIGDYLGRLGAVWVEGEVAEVTLRPGSSMAFIRLKDTSADISLQVTCHRSLLENGEPLPPNARIVAYAKVNWYAVRGTLSLMAREIRQVGIGELLARLEALKTLLASEGLFALDRKKELPFLPRKIGLICGRASAAEKDVVENVLRRWPGMAFEIKEVAVQGSQAVVEVSQALKELAKDSEVDVIIITRGGGSFEDLLPFSDESLIRLVATIKTPIVSAIGHEQDCPLLDLVADFRASTPTDAAKKVVPSIDEEVERTHLLTQRLNKRINSIIDLEIQKISALTSRPVLKDPQVLITSRAEVTIQLLNRSRKSFKAILQEARTELKEVRARVRSLSPQSTLDRGYAVVQKSNGELVRNPRDVKVGELVQLRLAKGEIGAQITGEVPTKATITKEKGK